MKVMSPNDPTQPPGSPAAKGLKVSHWFWGTIAALLLVTLALHFAANRHVERQMGDEQDKAEAMATQVERWFSAAGEEGAKVRAEIGPMLDRAYEPVYAGIPSYMDFHYSLKGEWLELGSAAIGDISSGLDKYLFSGLDRRLDSVAADLARDFDQRYVGALERATEELPGGTETLAPEVGKAIEDSKSRIQKTGKIVGGTVLGAATLKGMTKVFATKLGTKLATKVAAKTGTKWVAVAAGAGTGAAACSWTGPGAAACGVVGAVAVWVGTDLAMVKLDEHLTRKEFDEDLLKLVNEHKAATRTALETMLGDLGKKRDREAKAAVEKIALSELPDADKQVACKAAESLLGLYSAIGDNLQARSPAQVTALERELRVYAKNHLLAPLVDGMEQAIADPELLRPWVAGYITIRVDVPLALRKDHELRGRLTLGKAEIAFDWAEANAAGGYVLRADLTEATRITPSFQTMVELVQDRGMWSRNRTYVGSARIDVLSTLVEGSGRSPMAELRLTTTAEGDDAAGPSALVVLPLAGVSLPEQVMPEFCAP